MDKIIDSIQVEPIEFVKRVVAIAEPTQHVVVATKPSQHVQLVVELVQIKNPLFSKFQPVLVSSHSTKIEYVFRTSCSKCQNLVRDIAKTLKPYN